MRERLANTIVLDDAQLEPEKIMDVLDSIYRSYILAGQSVLEIICEERPYRAIFNAMIDRVRPIDRSMNFRDLEWRGIPVKLSPREIRLQARTGPQFEPFEPLIRDNNTITIHSTHDRFAIPGASPQALHVTAYEPLPRVFRETSAMEWTDLPRSPSTVDWTDLMQRIFEKNGTFAKIEIKPNDPALPHEKWV